MRLRLKLLPENSDFTASANRRLRLHQRRYGSPLLIATQGKGKIAYLQPTTLATARRVAATHGPTLPIDREQTSLPSLTRTIIKHGEHTTPRPLPTQQPLDLWQNREDSSLRTLRILLIQVPAL